MTTDRARQQDTSDRARAIAPVRLDIIAVRQSGDWTGVEPLEAALAEISDVVAVWDAGGGREAGLELELPTACELVVAFGDDADVAALNSKFRGKSRPTNVLSFPAAAAGPHATEPESPMHLGDVILAAETVAREADAKGLALRHHMQHLVVHGLLHCLGFDHDNDGAAEVMETREVAILQRLGIANPYLEAAGCRQPGGPDGA